MNKQTKVVGISLCCLIIGLVVAVKPNEEQEEFSSFVTINNGQIVSAYINGTNSGTEELILLQEKVKKSVGEYYGRDVEELEFKEFCMLEMDGITVEVGMDGMWVTVECDMEGEIVY